MRLNVKEAGADAISLNRWKCSSGTHASVSDERFQVEKKASEMLHYTHILIFLLMFFRNQRQEDFERPCHVFPRSEV